MTFDEYESLFFSNTNASNFADTLRVYERRLLNDHFNDIFYKHTVSISE